mmetsp:Transcript_114770/g.286831  ORF Transcript_114770/g.286831 Transcript_114770/m.286831 type:complete len:203 (+) Transcript_114770:611-1219(+)
MSTGFKSEIGLAVAMFPASAATFRICVLANQCSMSNIARSPRVFSWGRPASDRSMKFSSFDSVTAPPIIRAPALSNSSCCSSGTAAVETITGYSMCLNFVSIPTSVLPATIFAVGNDFFSANMEAKSLGAYHVTRSPTTFSGARAAAATELRSSSGIRGGGEKGNLAPLHAERLYSGFDKTALVELHTRVSCSSLGFLPVPS